MGKAVITVLMPAYNAADFIEEAIQSVLAQTFTDFELLIVNDGSADDTEKIIRSFADPRIRLINQANYGISAALNTGLSAANTDLIARFDADDTCYPHRLAEQYKFLRDHADHCIVGCTANYHDINDDYVFTYRPPGITNEEIQQLKTRTCPFIHSGVLYRKQPILDAGGYNPHAHTFEDHLLWIKVLQHSKAYNLPQTLLKVRLHPGSVTIDEKWRSKRFSEVKQAALRLGTISEKEGNELLGLIKGQDTSRIKEGSYYALLAKKYLWDNHQPVKARQNIRKTLSFHPADIKSYLMWLLSFLPKSAIRKIYTSSRNSGQTTSL
jgi:glycosyltransferase involved in cell wall biosynthesis